MTASGAFPHRWCAGSHPTRRSGGVGNDFFLVCTATAPAQPDPGRRRDGLPGASITWRDGGPVIGHGRDRGGAPAPPRPVTVVRRRPARRLVQRESRWRGRAHRGPRRRGRRLSRHAARRAAPRPGGGSRRGSVGRRRGPGPPGRRAPSRGSACRGRYGQASPHPIVITTSEAWTASGVRTFGRWSAMSTPTSAIAATATGLIGPRGGAGGADLDGVAGEVAEPAGGHLGPAGVVDADEQHAGSRSSELLEQCANAAVDVVADGGDVLGAEAVRVGDVPVTNRAPGATGQASPQPIETTTSAASAISSVTGFG